MTFLAQILKGHSFCCLIYALIAISLTVCRNMISVHIRSDISVHIRSDIYQQLHQKLSLIETYFEVLVSTKYLFPSNARPNTIRYVLNDVIRTATI